MRMVVHDYLYMHNSTAPMQAQVQEFVEQTARNYSVCKQILQPIQLLQTLKVPNRFAR